MIVDDKEIVRNTLSYLLDHSGFSTVKAEDGLDAVDKLKDQLVDLVLTDCEMPNMNGYDLIKYIKNKYNIPIIMISGNLDQEQAEQAGADYLLTKPVYLKDLIEPINKLLENYSLITP